LLCGFAEHKIESGDHSEYLNKPMSKDILEARRYIAAAREALQRGDKESTCQLGREAARLAPEMEDAWLVLTASDPDPRQAFAYAQQALKVNPASARARRGLERAEACLNSSVHQKKPVAAPRKHYSQVATPTPQSRNNLRNRLYVTFLIVAGCLIVGFAPFFAWTNPALASIVNNIGPTVSTQENLWAAVDIPKPSVTPIDSNGFVSEEARSREEFVDIPTSAPTGIPADRGAAPVAAEVTDTPGAMVMEIIADTQVPTNAAPIGPPAGSNGEHWIDVNLSEQRVYVYEGDVLVNSFLASTGLPDTPTVTGQYKIYVKVRIQDMSGPGYYLRDVPWVMYFYESYGFHGTYWHNNFGRPMSRGCVNLTIEDAAWLYSWASIGTVVNVHY
jgi:lipoprotein-anchoring transpeptidase ErfK/SrfK